MLVIRGMGQERWMFRVAVYGLEKGFVPGPGDAEGVSLTFRSYIPPALRYRCSLSRIPRLEPRWSSEFQLDGPRC